MSILKKVALFGLIGTLSFSSISFADEAITPSQDVMEIGASDVNTDNILSNELLDTGISDVNSQDIPNINMSAYGESSYDYSQLNPEAMQIFAIVMLGILIVMVLFVIIPVMIGMFIISRKMGYKHSWLAFIPLANFYTSFKIAGKKAGFVITYFLVLIAYFALSYFADYGMVYMGAFLLSLLVIIIMGIMLTYSISKRCGYGVGLTIGLVLLPNIFLIIAGVNYKGTIGQVSEVEVKEEVKEVENTETEENIAE